MDVNNKKLKIYFPEVEAGFGHIMTCRAVREIFEQKYGSQFDIVSNDFFKTSKNSLVNKYGNKLVDFVEDYTSHPAYGIFAGIMAEFWGFLSPWFTLHFPVFGSVKAGIDEMTKINPDVVFSTHWATNYYAMRIKKDRPYCIMYCPDAVLNSLYRIKSDETICSMETGLKKARNKLFYNSKKLTQVPFCIRNEVFDLYGKRDFLRNKLNLDQNEFVLVIAEGGYGNGKISKILESLLAKNLPITIVAIAGKNEKLYEEMKGYKVLENTTFIPLGFVNNILEYIACADLFSGKAGNMLAEPTFFGVPSLITGVSSLIEINIANYYTKFVKSAFRENNPKKAANLIEKLSKNIDLLDKYKNNALMYHDHFNAEKAADFLYFSIEKKFNLGEN